MAIPTLITAVLLIVVGIVGYSGAEPNPETGKVSMTALIPALFGVILAVCGLLAFDVKFRKNAMHGAAVVGLCGFFGGFMPLIRQYNKTGAFDPLKRSAIAGELTILLCAVFVGLCVNSFVQARKARRAAEGGGPV
jgi:hypothetical protein